MTGSPVRRLDEENLFDPGGANPLGSGISGLEDLGEGVLSSLTEQGPVVPEVRSSKSSAWSREWQDPEEERRDWGLEGSRTCLENDTKHSHTD